MKIRFSGLSYLDEHTISRDGWFGTIMK